MSSRVASQLNIRSDFARNRVRELAEKTGMTATELIEDALRGYVPPASIKPVGRLVERHGILVLADDGRPKISMDEAEAALEAARTRNVFEDG